MGSFYITQKSHCVQQNLFPQKCAQHCSLRICVELQIKTDQNSRIKVPLSLTNSTGNLGILSLLKIERSSAISFGAASYKFYPYQGNIHVGLSVQCNHYSYNFLRHLLVYIISTSKRHQIFRHLSEKRNPALFPIGHPETHSLCYVQIATRCNCMKWGPALIILLIHIGSVFYQELHHVQIFIYTSLKGEKRDVRILNLEGGKNLCSVFIIVNNTRVFIPTYNLPIFQQP